MFKRPNNATNHHFCSIGQQIHLSIKKNTRFLLNVLAQNREIVASCHLQCHCHPRGRSKAQSAVVDLRCDVLSLYPFITQ
jgi:hypothetical protein